MDKSKRENQPDELLRRKIEGYEVPVSTEVWARLDRRMAAKSRPLWKSGRFIAAATLTGLLLGAGMWIGVRDKRGVAPVADSSQMPLSPATDVEMEPHEEQIAYQRNEIRDEEVRQVPSGKAAEPKAGRPDENTSISLPPSGSVLYEESQHVSALSSREQGMDSLNVREEKEGMEATDRPQPGPTETRILVVYVSPPVPEADQALHYAGAEPLELAPESKKKKGLQRFFKQLKNAKTGEKIDWEELGLNPNRVFANVEHGIPQE